MTATDTNIDTHGHDDHHDHDDHGHPSDKQYIAIALILGVLTAVEVAMFVFEESLPVSVNKIGLLVLMAVKFVIVGGYFMHLKFDSPVLWQLFAAGLILAIIVYWIMLSAFEFSFWNDGFEDPGFWEGQEEFEANVTELSN